MAIQMFFIAGELDKRFFDVTLSFHPKKSSTFLEFDFEAVSYSS